MTIETKYNIGDEVWFMCDNKARQSYIVAIETMCGKKDVENPFKDYSHLQIVNDEVTMAVSYWVKRSDVEERSNWLYWEQNLFPTKEELLKSL